MASDYEGEPNEFALVVPIPTFIEKNQISSEPLSGAPRYFVAVVQPTYTARRWAAGSAAVFGSAGN
jgi:hypothetical protein